MSMNAGDNIGIMDAAFFVSKNELLTWLNTVFQVIVNISLCMCS